MAISEILSVTASFIESQTEDFEDISLPVDEMKQDLQPLAMH